MAKKRIIFGSLFIMAVFGFLLVGNVYAQSDVHTCCCKDNNGQTLPPDNNVPASTPCSEYCKGPTLSVTDCPPAQNGNSNNSGSQDSASLQDPLGLNGDVTALWARIIKALLGLVGIASLVAFVYAGFIFLISAGSSEQVKKAKDTMVYAVLGIFISMAAYVILNFVFKALQGSL